MSWRLFPAVLFAAAALFLAGCSDAVSGVRGRVVLNGEPLAAANVGWFPRAGTRARPQMCRTDADGQFALSPDAMPAGHYVVTVNKLVVEGQEKEPDDPEEARLRRRKMRAALLLPEDYPSRLPVKNVVPAEYQTREQSPLKVTLRAGENELPAFELGGRKLRLGAHDAAVGGSPWPPSRWGARESRDSLRPDDAVEHRPSGLFRSRRRFFVQALEQLLEILAVA